MELIVGSVRVRIVRPASLSVLIGPRLLKHIQITEGTGPVEIALGDNQFTTLYLEGLEKVRETNKFQRAPKWTCSDYTILQITPNEDGTECRIEAASPPKHGQVKVTIADQDDANVTPIEMLVTVGYSEKVSKFGISFDPPQDREDDSEEAISISQPVGNVSSGTGSTRPDIYPNAENPVAVGGGEFSEQGNQGTSGPAVEDVPGGAANPPEVSGNDPRAGGATPTS